MYVILIKIHYLMRFERTSILGRQADSSPAGPDGRRPGPGLAAARGARSLSL